MLSYLAEMKDSAMNELLLNPQILAILQTRCRQ